MNVFAPETLANLPDPVASSLAVVELNCRRFVAAVQADNPALAVGFALLLQAEAQQLRDWAQRVRCHKDNQGPRGADGGEGSLPPAGHRGAPLRSRRAR